MNKKKVLDLANKYIKEKFHSSFKGKAKEDQEVFSDFEFGKDNIIEIYGEESVGKTYWILKIIAYNQTKGKICLLLDCDNKFDKKYAARLGVDIDCLLLSHPHSADEAFKIIEEYLNGKAVDLIILDSIGGLVSEEEDILKESTFSYYDYLSTKISQVKKLILGSEASVIFVNQIRTKIKGKIEKTTIGGDAISKKADKIYKLTRNGSIKGKWGRAIGYKILVQNIKDNLSFDSVENPRNFNILWRYNEKK